MCCLGFGKVSACCFVFKIAVIVGWHCAWRWDEPLLLDPLPSFASLAGVAATRHEPLAGLTMR